MAGINSQHFHQNAKILEGFSAMIEKGAIRIEGTTMHLFPELWARNPQAFMANAYRYFRLKLKKPQGTVIWFKDIETDQLIGKFQNSKAHVIG